MYIVLMLPPPKFYKTFPKRRMLIGGVEKM